MKKVELLAPAGDLEKLKTAILYGADAVFIGGKKFSLRAKASNLQLKILKKVVSLLINTISQYMSLLMFILMN